MTNIKEKYPKSFQKLKEFSRKYLQTFQKLIVKESGKDEELVIPDIPDNIAEGAANSMLSTYPRILYDFFDENDVFISIQNEGRADSFVYDVGQGYSSVTGANRPGCEAVAFNRAFEELEIKLN